MISIALDLGTTRIKAAGLAESGRLCEILDAPAPPLTRRGLICESDPLAYAESATALLKQVLRGAPRDCPVGLASQRSSFLLWDKSTGEPVTPLISWQDRRAAPWCAARRERQAALWSRTGLPLAPHYLGPKLAFLLESDPALRSAARSGQLQVGTTESWLLWRLGGRVHQTDLSMAARTLLCDPSLGDWSDGLLEDFGVDRPWLPAIVPTWGRAVDLEVGGVVCATIADQSAGVVGCLGLEATDALLINLGTGAFILRPTGRSMRSRPGYLAGPILRKPCGEILYALEGAINGVGPLLEDAPAQLDWPGRDLTPDSFCLPDASGLGSPYWLPEVGLRFSTVAGEPTGVERIRLIGEGVIFRLRQNIEGLSGREQAGNIFLAGGLARLGWLGRGLAACLGRPLRLLHETQATLAGAASLAAGLKSCTGSAQGPWIEPDAGAGYLREKYERWLEWVGGEVGGGPG